MRIDEPHRLHFSPEGEKIWGEKGMAALEEMDATISPYSPEVLKVNPTLLAQVISTIHPNIRLCERLLIEFLKEATFGKKDPYPTLKPKKTCHVALSQARASLADVYPLLDSSTPFVQRIYLDTILYRALGEFLSFLITHHRNDRRTQEVLSSLSIEKDVPKIPTDQPVDNISAQITAVQVFFSDHTISLRDIEHLSVTDLDNLNIEIFQAIQRCAQYPAPLSVNRDIDICSRPICLVGDSIGPTLGKLSGLYAVEFELNDISRESQLLLPGALEQERNSVDQLSGRASRQIIIGQSIPIYIDRLDGNLNTLDLGEGALKVLLEGKKYQLLRAHLLFRYAQLVCDDATFIREFGHFVTGILPQGTSRDHTDGGSPGPVQSDPEPRERRLPVRFFPRAVRDHFRHQLPIPGPTVDGTGRQISQRRTGHHRRLLPLGFEPTQQAYNTAADSGVDLRYHFEVVYQIMLGEFTFSESNLATLHAAGHYIFAREDLVAEAQQRHCNVDVLIAQNPDAIIPRRYTYVSGHEFGDVPDAVRAVFRYEANAAADTSNDSSR